MAPPGVVQQSSSGSLDSPFLHAVLKLDYMFESPVLDFIGQDCQGGFLWGRGAGKEPQEGLETMDVVCEWTYLYIILGSGRKNVT